MDSGADVSLLPAKFLENFEFTFGKTRELVSFDCKKDVFQTARVQIIFNGIRFTGDFCLIDQDYGILGRDILNNFIIVLDGKNLSWYELK